MEKITHTAVLLMAESEKKTKKRKKKFKGRKIIVKSNELLQLSRTDLSLAELRAFTYLLTQLDENALNEYGDYALTFRKADFCDMVGIEVGNGGNNQYLKDTIKHLGKSGFEIERDNKWEYFPVLSYASLENMENADTEETLTVSFSQRIAPLLFGLKKNFTTYQIENILNLKSKYAFRLYEFLKSFHQEKVTVYIQKLRDLFGVKYPKPNDLIRYTIEPAVKELNEKTDLYVTFEAIRTGRATSAVEFVVHEQVRDDEFDEIVFEEEDNVEQLRIDI